MLNIKIFYILYIVLNTVPRLTRLMVEGNSFNGRGVGRLPQETFLFNSENILVFGKFNVTGIRCRSRFSFNKCLRLDLVRGERNITKLDRKICHVYPCSN